MLYKELNDLTLWGLDKLHLSSRVPVMEPGFGPFMRDPLQCECTQSGTVLKASHKKLRNQNSFANNCL